MNPRAEAILTARWQGGAAMAAASRSMRHFSQQAAFSSRVIDSFGRNATRAIRGVAGFIHRQATNVFRSFFFGIRIWAIAAGAAVSAFVGKSIKAFVDFDKKLRETTGLVRAGELSRSLTGAARPGSPGGTRITSREMKMAQARGKAAADAEYKAYRNAIIAMSSQVRRTPAELASGVYEVAQAGFTSPSTRPAGMSILRAGAMGASAGGGQTNQAVRSLITIANSLRLGRRNKRTGFAQGAKALAGKGRGSPLGIMDMIFQAISAGIGVEFGDLNRSLGTVVGPAGAFMNRKQQPGRGQNILTEIMGSMIVGTQAGMAPNKIAIGYTNMLQKIMKPSTQAKKLYESMGIKPGEGLLKGLLFGEGKGTSAIERIKAGLEKIGRGGSKMNESLSVLFGDVRGLRLLTTMVQQYDRLPAALALVRNAAGSTKAAFDEQGKSLQGQIDKFKTLWETLKIGLGAGAMPIASKAINWASGYVDKITGGALGAERYAEYQARPKGETRKEFLGRLKPRGRAAFKRAEAFNNLGPGGQFKRIGGMIWDDLSTWAQRPETAQQFQDIMWGAVDKGMELLRTGAAKMPSAYQVGLDLMKGVEQGIRERLSSIDLKSALKNAVTGGGDTGSFMGSKDPWDRANAAAVGLVAARGISSRIKGGGLLARGMRGGVFAGAGALAGVPDEYLPLLAAGGALASPRSTLPTGAKRTVGRAGYGVGRFLFGWPRLGGGGGATAAAAEASAMTTSSMIVNAGTVVVNGAGAVGGGGLPTAASTVATQKAQRVLFKPGNPAMSFLSAPRSQMFGQGPIFSPFIPDPSVRQRSVHQLRMSAKGWMTDQNTITSQALAADMDGIAGPRKRDARGRYITRPVQGPPTAMQALLKGNNPYRLPPRPVLLTRAGPQFAAALSAAQNVATSSLTKFTRGGASATKGAGLILQSAGQGVYGAGTTAVKKVGNAGKGAVGTGIKGIKGLKGAGGLLTAAAIGGGVAGMTGSDIVGIVGASAGAAIGSLAGPIGTVVGGAIGAVAGQKLAQWLGGDHDKTTENRRKGLAAEILTTGAFAPKSAGAKALITGGYQRVLGAGGIDTGGITPKHLGMINQAFFALARATSPDATIKPLNTLHLFAAKYDTTGNFSALVDELAVQSAVQSGIRALEDSRARHKPKATPRPPRRGFGPDKKKKPKRKPGKPGVLGPGLPFNVSGDQAQMPFGLSRDTWQALPRATQDLYSGLATGTYNFGVPEPSIAAAAHGDSLVSFGGGTALTSQASAFAGQYEARMGAMYDQSRYFTDERLEQPGAKGIANTKLPAPIMQQPGSLLDLGGMAEGIVKSSVNPLKKSLDVERPKVKKKADRVGQQVPRGIHAGAAAAAKKFSTPAAWTEMMGPMVKAAMDAAVANISGGGTFSGGSGNGNGGAGENPGQGAQPPGSLLPPGSNPFNPLPTNTTNVGAGPGGRGGAGGLGRSFQSTGADMIDGMIPRIGRAGAKKALEGRMGNALKALAWLRGQVGKPYIWGGGHPPNPGLEGYDCSGLASTALQMAGIPLAGTTQTMVPKINPGGVGPIRLGFNNATNPTHMGINVLGQWYEAKGRAYGILGPGQARSSWAYEGTPQFHKGGLFRSSMPGGEGLALLKDKELVVDTDGARLGKGGGGPTIVIHNMTVRNKSDAHELAAELARLLEQRSGNS